MATDLLKQLEELPLFPKFYWHKRHESIAIACAGNKEYPTPEGRQFGCFSFDGKHPLFFEPEIILSSEVEASADLFSLPKLLSRVDSPSFSEWEKLIHHCLHIQGLKKIVLARRTTLTFDRPISPLQLLSTLNDPNTTRFALQLTPHHAFIGATPEHLYERRGNLITTEALAGTKLKGISFGEKEQREFDSVKRGIEATLTHFCDEIMQDDQDRTIPSVNLSHLYRKFSGRLRELMSDVEIIRRLHPTAAIGGEPRALALKLIGDLEPFARKWYASPIGWYDAAGADFAVAIRSAEIEGNTIHLYAGAGILAGSDPQAEWAELEAKITPFTRFLG
jgi:menaquinone-specific isochorismate synthase